MLRLENVATLPTAATAVWPASVPPLGFDPITRVTWAGGEVGAPAAVVPGGTVNDGCVAGPPVMLNAPLELLRAFSVATSRYPVPTLSMLKSSNVATPATAARVV